MNADRMRRYAQRGREADELARRLAAMSPEHRAKHESEIPLSICPECVNEALARGMRSLERLAARARERQDGVR